MERIVVLGAGESGAGAAVLAKVKGFDVFVSDTSAVKEKYSSLLNEYGIEWEEGGHTFEKILNASEVIKSPGIPDSAPVIKAVKEKGIPVISEIEFAGRYTNAKMICITGSNGKTTTTLLTYHILKSSGLKNFDYYVIELSSFQLDNMYDFKANIAVLLNITPDHLDRYGYDMQNYINAKFRITRNQTEEDAFIYWNDDPIIAREVAKRDLKARLFPFAESKEDGVRAYKDGHKIVIDCGPDNSIELLDSDMALPGRHNLYNSMAASISAKVLDIKKDDIREALSGFKGVEHRIENAGRVHGVEFINDSKATNVNSCWYALESMKSPVVLILGGKDKGNDYTEIEELVRGKVKGIVCLGVDNSKLHSFFDGMGKPMADAGSMKEAVGKAYAMASPGDVVLLSPCCASFDLFKSYEDRGRQFKACVKEL